LKQLEKIEVTEIAPSSRRTPHFRFEPLRPSGRDVLVSTNISKAYGEHVVLRGFSLAIHRGDKVAVIGPNGLGKSTLLKIVTERLAADAGEVTWGHEVRIGYFPQDHAEVLDGSAPTPLEFLWSFVPDETPNFVRGHLGRVLLSGSDVDKRISALSGGEAARLLFAKLAVERPNVLVLDEPTNHLDLESIDALVEALETYEGTVLFVSHDRHFVSAVATRIVELTPSGPRDYPGTYADYLAQLGDDHLDADAVVLKARGAQRAREASTESASWEAQKRARNRRKELPARRDALLAEIEVHESRSQEILNSYAEPGFFEHVTPTELVALEAEQRSIKERVESLMAEWEAVEQELSAPAP
jgi:ABC-type multidrug transport system ATPase subunit